MRFFRPLAAALLLTIPTFASAADWPQWRGEKRDGVWREESILQKFPEGGPKVLWRAPIGSGYAGPAVAAGRVFLMDRVADENTQPGKDGTVPSGIEEVLCLSESDGKLLWKNEHPCKYTMGYGNGPRATPVVDADRVYTLGAMGRLACLKSADGSLVWEKLLAVDGATIPSWGFAAHPLLDNNKIITLTNDPAVVKAFDKNTGQLLWSALPTKDPGYCPPMVFEFAGIRQLIIWHPASVNALEPETGKLLWSHDFGPVKNGVSIVAPMQIDDRLFVTSFWDGGLMLKPAKDSVEVLWKKSGNPPKSTESLQSLMSAPMFKDGYLYGVTAGGALRCVDARDGAIKWETMAATTKGDVAANATAFLTPNADRVFIANDQGELIIANLNPNAYQELDRASVLQPTSKDGKRKVLWSHPAFANHSMFWRNDKELVKLNLAAP